MRARVLTGVTLAAIVLATVLLLDTLPASLVFGLFWLLGAAEWAGLTRLAMTGRAAYAGVFGAICLAVLIAGLPAPATTVWLLLAVAVWGAAFVCELKYPLRLSASPILAAGIVVLTGAWLAFHTLHGAGDTGPALILSGLAIVWSADIGAFFVGRGLGRTPLAPRVSPKKTWEGVAGGVVLASIVAAIAAILLDLDLTVFVPLAAGVALISVVGDLGISMLKRRAGMKDSGVLLPGHGGILDRFDGVTAALPFFVLGLQFANVLD